MRGTSPSGSAAESCAWAGIAAIITPKKVRAGTESFIGARLRFDGFGGI
jgi:hypothetical protein